MGANYAGEVQVFGCAFAGPEPEAVHNEFAAAAGERVCWCVCACVRACVRACVPGCAGVCVCGCAGLAARKNIYMTAYNQLPCACKPVRAVQCAPHITQPMSRMMQRGAYFCLSV